MYLRAKGIDNSGIGIGRGRQARGLSDDDGCVRGGQVIYDTSEGSETTTEAEGYRQRPQGIIDDDGGIGGGR